jgi:hypothetical protein
LSTIGHQDELQKLLENVRFRTPRPTESSVQTTKDSHALSLMFGAMPVAMLAAPLRMQGALLGITLLPVLAMAARGH